MVYSLKVLFFSVAMIQMVHSFVPKLSKPIAMRKLFMSSASEAVSYKVGFMFPGQGGYCSYNLHTLHVDHIFLSSTNCGHVKDIN